MWYRDGVTYNSQQAIRLDNPNTSLPHFLSDSIIEELGYVKVVDNDVPEYDVNLQSISEAVEVVEGIPTKVYSVVDKFADTPEVIDADGVTILIPAKSKAENEAEYLSQLAKALIPYSITPRQARLVLLKYGLLDDIETMITTDRELGIWWEYSLDIKRDDARLVAASNSMNITPEQLDQMFIEASVM